MTVSPTASCTRRVEVHGRPAPTGRVERRHGGVGTEDDELSCSGRQVLAHWGEQQWARAAEAQGSCNPNDPADAGQQWSAPLCAWPDLTIICVPS